MTRAAATEKSEAGVNLLVYVRGDNSFISILYEPCRALVRQCLDENAWPTGKRLLTGEFAGERDCQFKPTPPPSPKKYPLSDETYDINCN